MRFLALACLISLLLSVAIIDHFRVRASSPICVSTGIAPTIIGTPVIPTTQPSVVFNEILPSPHRAWNCAYQSTPNSLQNAWIELYNLLDKPLDLYAARTCIDTGPGTSSSCLPFGSIIPAHGFFTFFPYQINNNMVLSGISNLRLLLDDYVAVDQVSIPPLPPDVSYARRPDGTGKWLQDTAPTINSSNTSGSSLSTASSFSSSPTHLHEKRITRSKGTTGSRSHPSRSSAMDNNTSSTSISLNQDNHDQVTNTQEQVQWHGLQLPSPMPSSEALTMMAATPTPPSQAATPIENIPQKALFSLLGCAGLLGLWLGWRRFLKQR